MGLAAEQEVVAQREDDVEVGLEHEAAEQLGEGLLDRRGIEREELLELVHDHERVLVALAEALQQRDGRVRFFEAQQRLERLGIAGESRGERVREGLEGPVARGRDERLPALRQAVQQARAQERALARARGSDREPASAAA